MLLTITTTYQPATDLGFLLHKNPVNVQSFALNFGQAHIFYPEATLERCTAALLLDVDTIHLVRKKDQSLDQYVNDRPYVASSFLSVAIAEVFRSALNASCTARPELVQTPLPLSVQIVTIPSRNGATWFTRLFEPLGYTVTATEHLLDAQHPEWGMGPYYTVTLAKTCCLSELLTHLYVLIPVLDGDKHYWIGSDEVEKLLRRGQGWLDSHPERNQIAYRYLRRKSTLAREAIARLVVEEHEELVEGDGAEEVVEEKPAEKKSSLHDQRLSAVLAMLLEHGSSSVLDLGCGEGKLLKLLLKERQFVRILGLDVSYRALEIAMQRLHFERMPELQKKRISLIHGALTYRDKRLEGYDAAAVVEVIEHLDPARLAAFERVLFECAQPSLVVVTTPNAEYNVKFETLSPGTFRHQDHRFEWSREEFRSWATKVAERFGYTVAFHAIGDEDTQVGAPSQMGTFTRHT